MTSAQEDSSDRPTLCADTSGLPRGIKAADHGTGRMTGRLARREDIESWQVGVTSDEYSYSIGEAEDDGWYRALDLFQDASVFQTSAFCRAKMPGGRLEQLMLWRGSDVVASTLVRVVPLPLARTSVAYVLWGPLCHRWAGTRDIAALGYSLKVLRDEYVTKRGFGLRIVPMLTREDDMKYVEVFREHGYRHVAPRIRKHTIILDVNRPLEQLRKGFDQKWRNCLNGAERNNLEIRQGDEEPLFGLFLEVYREMLARKQLGEPGDIRSFMTAHTALPDRFKLRVFVALEAGKPAAGVICSAIGGRGVYVFGATGSRGMRNKASYLLQWRVLEWLRQRQCHAYDLHGANAEANPGVYAFKMGLCGKNGREVEMLGHFDAFDALQTRVLMAVADRANDSYKRLKAIYGRYRGFRG
jgi:lipid II:glycine glycyltransferase (peptidoglycan interpeptide bridge formation enzyme)